MDRLTISVEDGRVIKAMFNPNQFTVQKEVNWTTQATTGRDAPEGQFTHGQPSTLTLDLFFDTYEQRVSVIPLTDAIFSLTTVDGDLHRPPKCELSWGSGIFFVGILVSLTQRFTLFLSTGEPVRATLGCTFRQWLSGRDEQLQQKRASADVVKQRVVKFGDTLSSIANEEYQDPSLWRPIADANRLANPRLLTPGMSILVPALSPETATGR